jgi:NDP-sugar pyrophosphorylase family protein
MDYSLNWLAENSIEEVFLFYSTLKQDIEEYCQVYGKYHDLRLKPHYMKPT